MKKNILLMIIIGAMLFFAGCNLQAKLDIYSRTELINMSTNYCNSVNGDITIYNNTVDLLYLDCIVGNITTELYDNGNSYIERHNISKKHEISYLKTS